MANFFGTRYYNSDGSTKQPAPSASNLGLQSVPISQAITTTQINAAANRVYLAPLPAAGPRNLLGTWIKATAMDTNGSPTLVGTIVLIYNVNGVEQTPIVVVNAATLGIPFTAAIPMTWVDIAQAFPNNADSTGVHLVFLVNTAAATPAAGTLTLIPFYQ